MGRSDRRRLLGHQRKMGVRGERIDRAVLRPISKLAPDLRRANLRTFGSTSHQADRSEALDRGHPGAFAPSRADGWNLVAPSRGNRTTHSFRPLSHVTGQLVRVFTCPVAALSVLWLVYGDRLLSFLKR